jgi:hypothetical protein
MDASNTSLHGFTQMNADLKTDYSDSQNCHPERAFRAKDPCNSAAEDAFYPGVDRSAFIRVNPWQISSPLKT